MSTKDNGGPAFPHTLPGHTIEKGMTLRDYFAAKAMQGLLANTVGATEERFALQAYLIADAMLEARKK